MTDQAGPWTLDNLDLFSPSLDALAFSLDSTVWNTAYRRFSGGASTGAASATAHAYVAKYASGSASGEAMATGNTLDPVRMSISAYGVSFSFASARIRGEEWADTVAGPEDWQAVPTPSGVWSVQHNGSGEWHPQPL